MEVYMPQKTIVVYYSQSRGNTKRIAEMIQKATGADIERIDTVVPYTGSYEEVVAQGNDEVQRGYKPEIKPLTKNIAGYEKIIIGSPTWWYTMAQAVLTFLTSHGWSGKTVVPFVTNGGWPGHALKDIKTACPGASFEHEKTVRFDSAGGDHLETSKMELDSWVNSLA
jgi:flavodoxin